MVKMKQPAYAGVGLKAGVGLRRHEAGGTLLGLILGALLGLGAALAVAVYVTKVPIPFLNKGLTHGADDATEARKNKAWDPNASLAGKNSVRTTPPPAAAANSAADSSGAGSSPGEAAVNADTPAGEGATPDHAAAGKAASTDPLGDLAKAKMAKAAARAERKNDAKTDVKSEARPDAKAAEARHSGFESAAGPGGAVDPFSYFIQVGAFRTPEDAEQQRAKLTLLGFQARVTEREQSGRTVYRVRLGPFDRKDDAERTKERLDSNSVETALVRVQR